MSGQGPGVADVKRELEERGILLLSDKILPSLTTLVAAEPVSGSWWAHPRAHDIFRIAGALEDDPDVTTAKLVAGKVTFVHRDLWPALVAVGSSREVWQTNRLSEAAGRLIDQVDKLEVLRTDELPQSGRGAFHKLGDVVRIVERRLMVHSDEIHTDSGAHAKQLESWEHFAHRVRTRPVEDTQAAKRTLEEALQRLCAGIDGVHARLPWR